MLLTAVAFGLGALPFSIWLGRRVLHKDIRTVGDANPGATNVFRAGGRWVGILVLLLDLAKGALPVAVAYRLLGIDNFWLVPVALAPVAGHAFSPLLGGRGGKAVAVTGGIWLGMTLWEGPTVGGFALLIMSRIVGANGWAVLSAVTLMLLYLLLTPPSWNGLWPRPPVGVMATIGLGNLLILAWKHRHDLTSLPWADSQAASEK
jgi:glycerol-3-phosphate acyltransferase PlsY